jgi:3-oxoacid CoA-transferase subunit B
MSEGRERIVRRAAKELVDGYFVNLGIGIPTLVANHVAEDMDIVLHSENGLLGMGEFPIAKAVDADLINAGKQTVTAIPGASYFSSSDSFAMVRGGHIDLTILGAMDLVAGAKRVVVTMDHVNKRGEPKFLTRCLLPLTGPQVVDLLITDLAVFSFSNGKATLIEHAPGVSVAEIQEKSGASFAVSDTLTVMDS